jgi:hypothetical protein
MDRKSQLDRALEPLRILRLHEVIDAKTIANRTALTPRQAGRVLSIFHQQHYLAKVGTDNHYAQYVRTNKPLPAKGSSVHRAYRTQLEKKNQQHHIDTQEQVARKIFKAVTMAIARELRRQIPLGASVDLSKQLSLFSQLKSPFRPRSTPLRQV